MSLGGVALTVLSGREERILGQIIEWADEFDRQLGKANRDASDYMPTTARCSEHFRCNHNEMLVILNRLEKWGLLTKRRRMSSGLAGSGYDGSLHSEVVPTDKGRKVVAFNSEAS